MMEVKDVAPLFSLKVTESMHTSKKRQKSDKNVLFDLDLWPFDLGTDLRDIGQNVMPHFKLKESESMPKSKKWSKIRQKQVSFDLDLWPFDLENLVFGGPDAHYYLGQVRWGSSS